MKCPACHATMEREHSVSVIFGVDGWFWNCPKCEMFVQVERQPRRSAGQAIKALVTRGHHA